VELKSPTGKGRLSRKQEKEIERLRDEGVNVHVIDSYEEVDKITRNLTDAQSNDP
jgi:biotin operon repressor